MGDLIAGLGVILFIIVVFCLIALLGQLASKWWLK